MPQKSFEYIAADKPEMITSVADKLIIQSLAKLDQVALGVAVGTVLAVIIFLATNILVLKGGESVGPNLALLNQYFIGYKVSLTGSLIGLFYGFVAGFILGWLIAFLRNTIITLYLTVIKIRQSMLAVNNFIDNP